MADPPKSWEIRVLRIHEETRASEGYARTMGAYQVYHDGTAQPDLKGYSVEREGPGDNTPSGTAGKRCIETGTYLLYTHDAFDNDRYKTIGYSTSETVSATPRPALRLEPTGTRTGILIHPASGYTWSIGCIHPTKHLADARTNIEWRDSRGRVIALIKDLRSYLGSDFPTLNNKLIPNARCVISETLVQRLPVHPVYPHHIPA